MKICNYNIKTLNLFFFLFKFIQINNYLKKNYNKIVICFRAKNYYLF